jgi:transposase
LKGDIKVNSARNSFSNKSKIREMIFSAYIAGQLDKESVISRLGVSNRQFYRLQNKFITIGNLTHGLVNKPSNRSVDEDIKNKVLNLYKDKYRGFNYEHLSDMLIELDNINISPDTLRQWLLSAKLTLSKQRKPKKYMRRVPKARFNEMLQLDGTFDDFLGNGQMQCLMHLVDDATKTSLAYLYDAECTNSALDILYKWCNKYGIPESIYSDRHGTYKVNEKQRLTIEEELEGKETRLTAFGKVCERLGIKQIFAYSPQAKGRVERKHNLYKDRFVKELKLLGFTTMESANAYLIKDNGFTAKLNNKFTIEAREARTAHVLPTTAALAQQFTINNTRTVRNDFTISLHSQVLQLEKSNLVNARSIVTAKQHLDGSTTIWVGKNNLKYRILENYQKPAVEKNGKPKIQDGIIGCKKRKESPWRDFKPQEKRKNHNANSDAYFSYLATVFG